MKLREDTKLLSRLVGFKTIDLQEAKRISALPLLIVKGNIGMSFSDVGGHAFAAKFIDIKNLPFIEMAFLIEIEEETEEFIYGTLKHNKEKYILEFCDWEKDETGSIITIVTLILDEEACEVSVEDISVKYPKNAPADLKVAYLEHMKIGVNHLKRHAAIINYLQHFMKTNELNDRYLISVIKNKKPKLSNNREGEIAKIAGPRIIYLDRLPTATDKDPENIGMGSPKAAHQRRGTWVTLRAERYKNHPLYQVEKAIYRKPAWVGDRSTIVHGATYTVIDKENNFGE